MFNNFHYHSKVEFRSTNKIMKICFSNEFWSWRFTFKLYTKKSTVPFSIAFVWVLLQKHFYCKDCCCVRLQNYCTRALGELLFLYQILVFEVPPLYLSTISLSVRNPITIFRSQPGTPISLRIVITILWLILLKAFEKSIITANTAWGTARSWLKRMKLIKLMR